MKRPHRPVTRSATSGALLVAISLLALVLPGRSRAVEPTSPFQVVVSLEANPQGSARSRYEEILQDFANTVYDATEGAHRIERVLVFTGASAHDRADVIWQRSGRPESALDGIRGDGHVYMASIFTGGGPGGDALPLVTNLDAADPRAAGAVLAHEWAHYAYGLLDEHVVAPGDVPVSPSLMHSPWQVSDADRSWRNFSIAGPGTGPFQDTGLTAQHRAYLRSAWELLTDAPDIGARLTAPIPGAVSRVFYGDLVAPAALPLEQGPAPAVTIEWPEPCSAYVIAIDNSGSMTGQRLAIAKSLAAVLLASFSADSTELTVLSFSSTATDRLGPAIVSDDDLGGGVTQRDLFQDAIDQIAAVPATTSFAAALAAAFGHLDGAVDACEASSTRAVFFLSDGTNGVEDYSGPLGDLAAAGVPIYALDVNDFDPDATSNEMTPLVAATGGILLGPTAGFGETQAAFREANAPTGTIHPLEAGTATVPPGSPGTDVLLSTITVDPSLERFTLCAAENAPIGSLTLRSPDGTPFTPIAERASEPGVPGDDCSTFFAIDSPPQAGAWTLSARPASGVATSAAVSYAAFGQSLGDSIVLGALLGNASGTPVTYPEPLYVIASLGRELPVVGARIEASLDGGSPFPLRDDGVPPDAFAGDGRYTGALPYESDGMHEVLVTARNSLDIAAYSNRGLVRAPNIDGNPLPADPDVPIGGPLLRSVALQVETVGMATPVTQLDDPDVAVNGRISSAGEVDLFTVDLAAIDAALMNPGALEVRVSGSLLGMVPDLRVYDGPPGDPGTSLLGRATASGGASGVVVPVQASAGTVTAEVRHTQGGIGSYQISAGAVLGLAFGDAGLSSSPCDLALADKNDALDSLQAGLDGVPAAIVLVEESRGLEQAMIESIRLLANAPADTGGAGRFLNRAANRDSKALKRLRRAEERNRGKELKGARRKIENAREKLQKACRMLPDGGASLLP